MSAPNVYRTWPPASRDPYPHQEYCTYGKGFGSSPSCDCGTDDQNDLLEAYWEGYDHGQQEMLDS